jgi:hypothetical protein
MVFDQQLRWKEHVEKVIERAAKTSTAIGGLRHLRPLHLRALSSVQRASLIRILSSFRTVATQTLEIETYTPPTRLRLKRRAQNVVAGLYTLPPEHPMWAVIQRAERRTKAKGNDPKFPLVQVLKTMDITELKELEKIDPRPTEPWGASTTIQVKIVEDSNKAIEEALSVANSPNGLIYAEVVTNNKNTGAATVIMDRHGNVKANHEEANPNFRPGYSEPYPPKCRKAQGARDQNMSPLGPKTRSSTGKRLGP